MRRSGFLFKSGFSQIGHFNSTIFFCCCINQSALFRRSKKRGLKNGMVSRIHLTMETALVTVSTRSALLSNRHWLRGGNTHPQNKSVHMRSHCGGVRKMEGPTGAQPNRFGEIFGYFFGCTSKYACALLHLLLIFCFFWIWFTSFH